MAKYFNKNLVGTPVLQVTFTREADDSEALYREATLPFAYSKDTLDMECRYTEHFPGIDLDVIDCYMYNQTPGAVIKSFGTEYNAIQLAAYISAYKLADEEERCLAGCLDQFKLADTECKRLLAICSIEDLNYVLSKNYAGILITDFYIYPYETVKEKLDKAYSTMNGKMRRTPIFLLLPHNCMNSMNYELYISRFEVCYNYKSIGVKAPENAYLERVLYDRCLRRGIELEESIDLRKIVEQVGSRVTGLDEIEIELDEMAEYINYNTYFVDEITTEDFLVGSSKMINENELCNIAHEGTKDECLFDEFDLLDRIGFFEETGQRADEEEGIEIADYPIMEEFLEKMTAYEDDWEPQAACFDDLYELDIPEVRMTKGDDNEYYSEEGERIWFENISWADNLHFAN